MNPIDWVSRVFLPDPAAMERSLIEIQRRLEERKAMSRASLNLVDRGFNEAAIARLTVAAYLAIVEYDAPEEVAALNDEAWAQLFLFIRKGAPAPGRHEFLNRLNALLLGAGASEALATAIAFGINDLHRIYMNWKREGLI